MYGDTMLQKNFTGTLFEEFFGFPSKRPATGSFDDVVVFMAVEILEQWIVISKAIALMTLVTSLWWTQPISSSVKSSQQNKKVTQCEFPNRNWVSDRAEFGVASRT